MFVYRLKDVKLFYTSSTMSIYINGISQGESFDKLSKETNYAPAVAFDGPGHKVTLLSCSGKTSLVVPGLHRRLYEMRLKTK
jgi:hypothetical protein